MYELRIAYDEATTLGQADVRSRHEHIQDAAEAFVFCTAPLKQLLWIDEDGSPDWLDDDEEAVVARVAAQRGLEIDEVGDDAR